MPSAITGPATKGLQLLAIPAVCLLIIFLGYSSQWLFHTAPDLNPGPPSTVESVIFNGLLLCLWWTYYKACTVDPGRYVRLSSAVGDSAEPPRDTTTSPSSTARPLPRPPASQPPRQCKKCRAPKPPRAHHCRHCGRCIPKMDHHCPWTGNCVSLTTFPHFLRFLAWTNASLWFLAYLLWQRFAALWEQRHLPAYLGPTLPQLVHVTVLALFNSAVSLALGIMLYTTARGWVLNRTMIEGWEMERHEALVDRYGDDPQGGGWWDGTNNADDDDDNSPWDRVEFPYDIGMFDNMAQAMGTQNVLRWFLPTFPGGGAGGPTLSADGTGLGWTWPENGFNAREGMWPPPDPDKLRRAARVGWPASAARLGEEHAAGRDRTPETPEESRAAFLARQAADFKRRQRQRNQMVEELEELKDELYDVEQDTDEEEDGDVYDDLDEGMDGKPGWTNSDGDRLRDYGVDEDVEAEDLVPLEEDEDVPLAELIRRRKPMRTGDSDR